MQKKSWWQSRFLKDWFLFCVENQKKKLLKRFHLIFFFVYKYSLIRFVFCKQSFYLLTYLFFFSTIIYFFLILKTLFTKKRIINLFAKKRRYFYWISFQYLFISFTLDTLFFIVYLFLFQYYSNITTKKIKKEQTHHKLIQVYRQINSGQ